MCTSVILQSIRGERQYKGNSLPWGHEERTHLPGIFTTRALDEADKLVVSRPLNELVGVNVFGEGHSFVCGGSRMGRQG